MTKIAKNTTGSDISLSDTGITVPASGQYTLNESEYILWAQSTVVSPATQLVTLINSGDIVVNDGTTDLGAADGIRFLQYPDRFRTTGKLSPIPRIRLRSAAYTVLGLSILTIVIASEVSQTELDFAIGR